MSNVTEPDYYTLEEAAKVLGITRRTVYIYIQKGALRKERRNGRAYVRKSDVIELRAEAMVPEERLSWKSLKQFQLDIDRRITHMEKTMEQAMHFLGFSKSPLDRLTDNKLRQCMTEAYDVIAQGLEHLTIEEITAWADILAKVDEEALYRAARLEQKIDAWLPFWDLVRELHEHVVHLPNYDKDYRLRDLGWSLSQSKSVIRGLALVIMTSTPHSKKRKLARAKLGLGKLSSPISEYVYTRLQ